MEGGIIQTPDFFNQKEAKATFDIGGNMQLAALFDGGAVFGMKFDPRQNVPLQWFDVVTSSIVLSGWRDYSHFQMIKHELGRQSQGLADSLGDNYITLEFLAKSICPMMKHQFEVSVPYSLDLLLVDIFSKRIMFVDFKGQLKILKGFGILGGYRYVVETAEDNPKDPEEIKVAFPKREAILYLEKKFNGKDFLDSKEEAVSIVAETLARFDPPSKKESFMLTTYTEEKFECVLVERKKSKLVKTEIKNNKKS